MTEKEEILRNLGREYYRESFAEYESYNCCPNCGYSELDEDEYYATHHYGEEDYYCYGDYPSHKNLLFSQVSDLEYLFKCKPFYNLSKNDKYLNAVKNQVISINYLHNIEVFIKSRFIARYKNHKDLFILNPAMSLRLFQSQYKFAKDIITKEFGV